jgi:hypothetical protein
LYKLRDQLKKYTRETNNSVEPQIQLGESTMFLWYKCWFKEEHCIRNLEWRICPRRLPVNNLYMETGWEKLKDRRKKHKLVQFYKMTKNLTPHYISCLVPQAFANIHDYNTHNLHQRILLGV